MKRIRSISWMLALIACIFASEIRGQACGVWEVTTSVTLVTAVSDACAAGGGIIKIATGTYVLSAPLVLCSDITLEGGYNLSFTTKSSSIGATIIERDSTNIQSLPNSGRLVALEASTQSNFEIRDLTIQVVAAPIGTQQGVSTYCLHLNNCSLYEIVRCNFIAGDGSMGASGVALGTFVAGTGGAGGGGGGQGSGCNGGGSVGSVGTAGSGGSGGGGGAGGGGAPGDGCNLFGCDANGTNGSVGIVGTVGPAGTGFVPLDRPATNPIAGTYFLANGQSVSGGPGLGGGGGGGGGGGAIGTCCTCSCGSGSATGGTGGIGGNAGTGGTGGYGGGGSFAVFLFSNISGSFMDCDINASAFGSGGDGGNGQVGQSGAAGNAGGTHTRCGGRSGGNGGVGGQGGDGGRGRDGADGFSTNFYLDGIVPTYLNDGSVITIFVGINSPLDFGLAAQPLITIDDITCTNTNLDFTAGVSQAWNLGAGSNPSTPTGATVTSQYSSIGRKDIVYGGDLYSGFVNMASPYAAPAISISGATEICLPDSLLLSASIGYASYQWQLNGIDIAGAVDSSYYATGAGTYHVKGVTLCCGLSDTSLSVAITVSTGPTPDAGPGGTVCALSFAFNALPSIGVGAWSQMTGPGSSIFNDTISPNDTVTVNIGGIYVFAWTETNGTCVAFDTVEVTFAEQPVANAGPDTSACDSSYTLNASASAGIGTWTLQSGPGTTVFSNANNPFSVATVSAFGFYTYQWVEVSGICSDTDLVTIEYGNQPVADAGAGGEVCGFSYTMSATPSFGSGVWTQWFGMGTGSFSDSTDPTAVVTVSVAGMYVFAWTELNGSCSDVDTLTVIFTQGPIANAGAGGTSCGLDFLLAAFPTAGTGTWTQTSGPGTAVFTPSANSPVSTATILSSETGSYVFMWTEVNSICTSSDTVSVTYFSQPIADAGFGGTECDSDFTFTAVPSLGVSSGMWTQFSGVGTTTFSDPTSPTTSLTISEPGTYIYTWTETNGPCSDFQDIVVVFSAILVPDAGVDTSVSLGNSVQLDGQGGYTYAWTPDTFLNFASVPDPITSPLVTTVYSLEIADINGCTAVDTVTVTVLVDYNFVISNLITPNGDGYNDLWYIDNIDFYSECEVAIYNRYGYMVYSKSGYVNDWDGTSSGTALPDGTYYFVITCPGSNKPFKGPVTIMRN